MKEIVLYVLLKDGKIVLEKRKADEKRYPSLWAIPSGHVEVEDKVSTLMKEVKEETGCTAEEYVLLESISYQSGDDKSLNHVFLITKFSGNTKAETDEGRRLEWFSIEEAKDKLSSETDFHAQSRKVLAMVEKFISSQKQGN